MKSIVLLVQVLVPLFKTVQEMTKFCLGLMSVPLGGLFPVTTQSQGSGVLGKRVAFSSAGLRVAALDEDELEIDPADVVGISSVDVTFVNMVNAIINVGVKVGVTGVLVGKRVAVGVNVFVEVGKKITVWV
jgi:hypothetical protein